GNCQRQAQCRALRPELQIRFGRRMGQGPGLREVLIATASNKKPRLNRRGFCVWETDFGGIGTKFAPFRRRKGGFISRRRPIPFAPPYSLFPWLFLLCVPKTSS